MTDTIEHGMQSLLDAYRTMWRIRAFEEAAEKALLDGKVNGAVHLSIGQEAIAAGVCTHLLSDDVITTTHRGHGHAIAKGASPAAMMSELFGRADGACGGMGGSMHIADFSVGMLGANGVVAAGLPIAVGAAQAFKLRGESGRVACAFFGDGATNRGPFFEALNWAEVFALPVLFVCEDNGFSATTRTREVSAGPGPFERALSIGLQADQVDGNDVAAVAAVSADLLASIRNGGGPRFLHAQTYRLKGHTAVDPATYRPDAEVRERWQDDPITRCGELLRANGIDYTELAAIEQQARSEMANAAEGAERAPWPEPKRLWRDVQDAGAPMP